MQQKVPLPGKIFARCIPKRLFAGLFGCMARISCQSQPVFGCMARESCHELAIFPSETTFRMHGAQNLPRIAARERTVVKSCHGLTLEDAPREYIATASQAKSASGRSPAAVGRWGTHFANILPSASAQERIAREYRHCQSPKSAFAKILPWTNAWIRPHQITAALPAKKTAPKAGLGERLPARSTKDRVLARLG